MRTIKGSSIAAGVALGLAGLLAAGPAWAASASTSFSVTASVSASCTIRATAISFGAYDPVVTHAATPLDGTGTVTITCTKGAVATVGLNTGLHGASAQGTTRAMTDGSSGVLSYEIYQDSGRSTLWGNTGPDLFAPAAAPSKAPRSFNTYGRVPAAQDVPSGS